MQKPKKIGELTLFWSDNSKNSLEGRLKSLAMVHITFVSVVRLQSYGFLLTA